MIVIFAMSSEYKRVFTNARRLITLISNYLKNDIIEATKCLSICYNWESRWNNRVRIIEH